MYVCMYVCMYVYVNITYSCIFICTYVCTHVCKPISVYTYVTASPSKTYIFKFLIDALIYA